MQLNNKTSVLVVSFTHHPTCSEMTPEFNKWLVSVSLTMFCTECYGPHSVWTLYTYNASNNALRGRQFGHPRQVSVLITKLSDSPYQHWALACQHWTLTLNISTSTLNIGKWTLAIVWCDLQNHCTCNYNILSTYLHLPVTSKPFLVSALISIMFSFWLKPFRFLTLSIHTFKYDKKFSTSHFNITTWIHLESFSWLHAFKWSSSPFV